VGQAGPEPERVKDPAAIHRGHLGGIKGGKARAARLTAEQRSESARRAAKARWERERGQVDFTISGGAILLTLGVVAVIVLIVVLLLRR
jgi:hypothetical protein